MKKATLPIDESPVFRVSILWWNATSNPFHQEFEIVIAAKQKTSEDEAKEYLPTLMSWFERLSPSPDALRVGVQQMLSGCFDFGQEEPPFIEVDLECVEYGTYQNYPRVEIPVLIDTQLMHLEKKDEKVRWLWSEIFASGMFLSIMDDEGTCEAYGVPISSLALDFQSIAAGAVQVANELGLVIQGTPAKTQTWRRPPDAGQYEDDQICIPFRRKANTSSVKENQIENSVTQKACEIAASILAKASVEGAVERSLHGNDPEERTATLVAFQQIVSALRDRAGMEKESNG